MAAAAQKYASDSPNGATQALPENSAASQFCLFLRHSVRF